MIFVFPKTIEVMLLLDNLRAVEHLKSHLVKHRDGATEVLSDWVKGTWLHHDLMTGCFRRLRAISAKRRAAARYPTSSHVRPLKARRNSPPTISPAISTP